MSRKFTLRPPRRPHPRPHLVVHLAQAPDPASETPANLVSGARRRALLARLGIDDAPPLEFVYYKGDHP
jgi:hypothetical protein